MWQRQADAMDGASLWWVTPDMTTLAADTALSGDELPPWHPGPDARAGLLVWDGGLPVRVINRTRHREDVEVSIDAVSWAPIPDGSQHPDLGGIRIEVWTRAGSAIVTTPMPLELITIRLGDGHDPRVPVGADMLAAELAVWRILCATMLLSQQPTAGGTRPADYARDGAPKDTRRRTVPADAAASTGANRLYSHRWIVRGHIRTYHIGPAGRSRPEKRWVAPYVAGPDAAPLIRKEHVWVWRR